MYEQDFLLDLERAGIFPANLAGPRYANFAIALAINNEDLTGYVFQAHIREERDQVAGTAPLGVLNVALDSTTTQTWQDMVDDEFGVFCDFDLDDVPDCVDITATITTSILMISAPRSTMESLPFNDSEGRNTDFFYDIKTVTPDERVLFTGTFTVIAGATQ